MHPMATTTTFDDQTTSRGTSPQPGELPALRDLEQRLSDRARTLSVMADDRPATTGPARARWSGQNGGLSAR